MRLLFCPPPTPIPTLAHSQRQNIRARAASYCALVAGQDKMDHALASSTNASADCDSCSLCLSGWYFRESW